MIMVITLRACLQRVLYIIYVILELCPRYSLNLKMMMLVMMMIAALTAHVNSLSDRTKSDG